MGVNRVAALLLKGRLGGRKQRRLTAVIHQDAAGIDEDEPRASGGKLRRAPRFDRVEHRPPDGLGGQRRRTLGDHLRVAAGGREDLPRLQRARRQPQAGESAENGDQRQGD